MENNYPQDFEKFIRSELQHVPARPDEGVWSQIAARQSRKNGWLRLRYYGPRGLGLTLVAVLAIMTWHSRQPAAATRPEQVAPEAPAIAAGDWPDMWPPNAAMPPAEKRAEQFLLSDIALRPTTAKPLRPAWYGANSVPLAQVRFRAEQGIQYRNPVSGNSVTIPPNVLIYADGTPVEGSVTLLFREYRGIADFLASGMPMHYTDEKGDFFFNSGGMFEVRVSQEGEDLFIAPGKTYDVSFSPTNKLKDANWFYLSDSTNQWSHAQGEVLGKNGASPLRVLSEADVIRDNTAGGNPGCLPESWKEPTETDQVAYMEAAITAGRQLARGAVQVPGWFRKNADKTDNFFLKGLERSDIRIVRQNDGEGERFFPDDLNGVFTELSVFKNCYFIRRTDSTDMPWRPDPENSVDAIYRNNRTWRRVEIFRGQGAECTVVFGDEKEEIHLFAQLAQSHEAPKNVDFDAVAILDEYERLRRQRHAATINSLQQWRRFMMIADMFQTTDEWCMTTREWFDYFDRNRPLMAARYDSLYNAGLTTDAALIQKTIEAWRANVRRLQFARTEAEARARTSERTLAVSLAITGFGTYNCDQIFQLAQGKDYLVPRYNTPDGQRIVPSSTRIVERQTRLFLSLPNERLLKFPGRQVDVIVTGVDGRTYYLPAEEYARLDLTAARDYTFTMEDVTEKVGTPLAWAELLGI